VNHKIVRIIKCQYQKFILRNDFKLMGCMRIINGNGRGEDDSLLGYSDVQSRTSRPSFQKCVLLPSSGEHRPDGGGGKYLSTVSHLQYYAAEYHRQLSSAFCHRENKISHNS
jgi:hypothetical protein